MTRSRWLILDRYFQDVGFPVRRERLLERAVARDAPDEVVRWLRGLPPGAWIRWPSDVPDLPVDMDRMPVRPASWGWEGREEEP